MRLLLLFAIVGCGPSVIAPAPAFVVTDSGIIAAASPQAASPARTEADHRDRIADAWRAAGIDCREEVTTPDGARCDLVTPEVAYELDFARKWAEGVGQARFYAADLDRRGGLVLLVDRGEERFVERARTADGDLLIVEVPLTGEVPLPAVAESSGQGSLDDCPCGADCECEGCCCEGATCKDSLQVQESEATEPVRELVVFSAEWCGPCRAVKSKAEGIGGIRFLDIDTEAAEAAELWGGTAIAGYGVMPDRRPAAIPCYALLVDGEVVMRWGAGSNPNLRAMLDYEPPAATVFSAAPGKELTPFVKVGAGQGIGSGVIIGRTGGQYVALTNSHVVRTGAPHRVDCGGWRSARVIADDPNSDLALLAFNGAEGIEVAPLATVAPANGTAATTHGFPLGGSRRERPTTLTRQFPGGGTAVGLSISRAGFQQGESGGAVMADGHLVGLVTGTDAAGFGLVVDHQSIKAFLARHGFLATSDRGVSVNDSRPAQRAQAPRSVSLSRR